MPQFEATTFSPTKKVLFANARDVWDYVRTPLNPEQIIIELGAMYGQLNPLGWSTSLQQYAYTHSPSFDVEMRYTMQQAERNGLSKEEFEKAYAFYLSFCFPQRRGTSPSEIYMVVPNTFRVLCKMHRCRVAFEKWTTSMQLREYVVSVSLVIFGETFRPAANVRRLGYDAVDTKLASRDVIQLGRLANTPLRMAGNGSGGTRPPGK